MNFQKIGIIALFLGVLYGIPPTKAQSLIEPDYEGEAPLPLTPIYERYSPDSLKVDQNFITGMRPHHAGGLSMSEGYLASADKSSKHLQTLAHAIIRNQKFEILMLDTVENAIQAITFEAGKTWYKIGARGLAHKNRFVRNGIPALQKSFHGDDPVSSEDVRFAKAMIVHHEGALMMCDEYLDDPARANTYLSRMCLDILRDQKQEIALMHNIVSYYPGNPDDIEIDASMIHGMEGMGHHMHHLMGH